MKGNKKKNHHAFPLKFTCTIDTFLQSSPNVSIMDQLNRGVKVEGLMLPPGITLTRVDPTSAEGLRAKKEAISRVSKSTF